MYDIPSEIINKIENTVNYKLKGSKDIKNGCGVMEAI